MAAFKSLSPAISPSPSPPLPAHFNLSIVTVFQIITLSVLFCLIFDAIISRRRRAKNGVSITQIISTATYRESSLINKLCSDLQTKPSKNTNLALSKMIEQFRVCIVVFSQDFAGSPQCLDMLVKVHEWRKKTKRTVIPVFYNVDPSHVRELRGSYELLGDSSQVQKWRHALEDISGLCGFNMIPEYQPEAKLISVVSDHVPKSLKPSSVSPCLNVEAV